MIMKIKVLKISSKDNTCVQCINSIWEKFTLDLLVDSTLRNMKIEELIWKTIEIDEIQTYIWIWINPKIINT